MSKPTAIFDVFFPGEPDAGLRSFTDIVRVTVDSQDPGGEEGEFMRSVQAFLEEWYDGATVTLRSEGG